MSISYALCVGRDPLAPMDERTDEVPAAMIGREQTSYQKVGSIVLQLRLKYQITRIGSAQHCAYNKGAAFFTAEKNLHHEPGSLLQGRDWTERGGDHLFS